MKRNIHPLKISERVQSINKELIDMSQSLEKVQKESVIGSLVSGLLRDLSHHTRTIMNIAEDGLKDTFLFSGKYTNWFSGFSKKDILLLDYLLEYQRNHVETVVSSLEAREIRDTFMDFFIDEEFHESFEATELFVDMHFLDDPTEEIKRCLNSPNFIKVINLACKIGTTMRSFNIVIKSASFYDKVIGTLDDHSPESVDSTQMTDIAQNFNTAITLMNHHIKGIKYTYEADADIPYVQIKFENLLQIWICLIDSLVQAAITTKENEIHVKIKFEYTHVLTELFVNCESEDLGAKIKSVKTVHSKRSTSRTMSTVYDYDSSKRYIEENGGELTIEPIKGSGIRCAIKLPAS